MASADAKYTTLARVKELLGIDSNDTTYDNLLDTLIEQASRTIDAYTNTRFYTPDNAETRYFDIPADDRLVFDSDLVSVSSVTNGDGSGISASDYVLLPANKTPKRALELKPTSGVVWKVSSSGETLQVIQVTGFWGYSNSAPEPVRRACEALVAHWFSKRGAEGVQEKQIGQFRVRYPDPKKVGDIPDEIASILLSYRRNTFA